MIRAGARAKLWQWREVLVGAVVIAAGFWVAAPGGYLLVPLGLGISALGLGLTVLGVRRLRFGRGGFGPGIVTLDEGEITYMGPQLGGSVSLNDLAEVRLMTLRGKRVWRLKQTDGQAILIPLDASGADALFDAFSALPGLSSAQLVAAIDARSPVIGANVVSVQSALDRVVWLRPGAGVLRR